MSTSTPFTYPAQYAQFRRLEAQQKRNITQNEYAEARDLGVYRDNMGILYSLLINVSNERFAKRFTDNIGDIYDVGYQQSSIDIARKMKLHGDDIDYIVTITGLEKDEISKI